MLITLVFNDITKEYNLDISNPIFSQIKQNVFNMPDYFNRNSLDLLLSMLDEYSLAIEEVDYVDINYLDMLFYEFIGINLYNISINDNIVTTDNHTTVEYLFGCGLQNTIDIRGFALMFNTTIDCYSDKICDYSTNSDEIRLLGYHRFTTGCICSLERISTNYSSRINVVYDDIDDIDNSIIMQNLHSSTLKTYINRLDIHYWWLTKQEKFTKKDKLMKQISESTYNNIFKV